VVKSLHNIDDPRKLVDVICAHLPLKAGEKQQLLETPTLMARIEAILAIISREIELAELEKEINERVKTRMGKTQRNYFLGEKVKEIQSEMGQGEDGLDDIAELEEAAAKKKLPSLAREKITKELKNSRICRPCRLRPPSSVTISTVFSVCRGIKKPRVPWTSIRPKKFLTKIITA
jgi:ATP-dependent Lon protease